MLKRHTFWLWLAVAFLFLTGLIHAVGLFISPVPANETERQMIELMMNYKQDLGAGFHKSMWSLFTALSSCFTFVFLMGGATIAFLLKRNASALILKGLVGIYLLLFGIIFVVMVLFTFLPPIVLTGLVVIFLGISWLTIPKQVPAT